VAGAGGVAADLERGISALPVELVGIAQLALREAYEILAPVAASSSQHEMHQAAAALEHALGELERAQAAFIIVHSAIQRLITALMGAGDGTAPFIEPNRVGKFGEPVISAVKSSAERGTDDRAADLLAKLPVRNESHRKTSGYWIDDNGTEHGPLVSGRGDGYREANEVLRALGIGPERGELWTAAHVEVKLAARLRRANAQHVTLAVNKKPCDEDVWSCDELLPQILKPDQQLTVYWPDGGKRTYRGRRP
jgi:hypothetical protein